MLNTLTNKFFFFFLTLILIGPQVCASELSELMKQGNMVLMMRHAYAPGVGDPTNFKLNDCSTQRNLNQEGMNQAQSIGKWLRAQGLTEATVYSSPWCRCIDTAKLLNLGSPQILEAIASTFNEQDYATPAKKSLIEWMQAHVKKPNSKPQIMVTHQVNILAYTGVNTSSGEMVLVQVNQDGTAKVLKTFLPQ
ncbi:phosphoglycerate mutase [Polynucleobacter sp. SHI8]|uniref:histidine phosphatase family protein n=1 Tax=unclassified Polynucleobacter TaxID=2640945 RepID=UPI0024902042|nr:MULTISPECIES: histidine phosphatase family protein [unclassified Polynucleobacter]BDW10841.1 phosphoglycerate mutase [Polynucleobacter sp. SHI2]BDW13287.1 phosphoglycerate mutase [Polynucleobacter sp. SHI8]